MYLTLGSKNKYPLFSFIKQLTLLLNSKQILKIIQQGFFLNAVRRIKQFSKALNAYVSLLESVFPVDGV